MPYTTYANQKSIRIHKPAVARDFLQIDNKEWMAVNKQLETPDSFRNNAAYVQNWLQVLKNDKRFIVSAAGKAEKAVNLILGAAG